MRQNFWSIYSLPVGQLTRTEQSLNCYCYWHWLDMAIVCEVNESSSFTFWCCSLTLIISNRSSPIRAPCSFPFWMLFLLWFQQLTGWTLKKKSKWERKRATLTAGFYFNQFFYFFKIVFKLFLCSYWKLIWPHTQADLKMKMMLVSVLVGSLSFRSLALSLLAVLHSLTVSLCFNPIIFRSLFSNDGHLVKKNFVESFDSMYRRAN